MRILCSSFVALCVAAQLTVTLSAEEAHKFNAVATAARSIDETDLKRHVQALADDTFEGREAGSRGGRAASIYLGREFQRHHLAGGAAKGYYQPFGSGYRNILGRLEGADAALRDEVVIVSAHYDHVGYGTSQNSYGPTGYIHNGADDNASGVAGLLETVEAFSKLPSPPRRTVLFALWDGEEKGLLGSKHWLTDPSVPLSQVVCLINTDMIGRLEADKIEIYGVRTAPGLRRLLCMQNRESDLGLNLTWEMVDNSDHYPFYERGIPVLMLHTGLHGDYHRPSDDVERIRFAGMQRISKLIFGTLYELASQDIRPRFRTKARGETTSTQRYVERGQTPLDTRLGVRFDAQAGETAGIPVSFVEPNSPAQRAGLRSRDRIIEFAGTKVGDLKTLRRHVWAAKNPVTILVERAGADQPVALTALLDGTPIRLGITWRVDEAEPGCVILDRVVPGTAAADAGLKVNDRIYEVAGKSFANPAEFRSLLDSTPAPVELLFERGGRIRTTLVELPIASN